jgi:hypothetical protein
MKNIFIDFRFALILIALGSSLSCVKRPANFSPEPEEPLSFPTLFDAVSEGFGNQTMSDLKTGEFTNRITTVQIADLTPQVTNQLAQQNLCYDKAKDSYKIVQTKEIYSQDGKSSKASTEHNYSFLAPFDNNLVTSYYTTAQLLYLCDPSQPFNKAENAVCSKLVIDDFSAPPPSEVKNSSDCGGLDPCLLDYRRISYYRSSDMIDESSGDTIRNKVFFTALFARNAPFLSRLIEFCQQGIFDIDKKTSIYAKICERTRNFKVGESNQTLCTP